MSYLDLVHKALHQIASGLPDSLNHYFLLANYYDYVDTDWPRCLPAALWFNANTVQRFELRDQALRCEVVLDQTRRQWSLIRVPYDQIWQLLALRVDPADEVVFADGRSTELFFEPSRIQIPLRTKPAESATLKVRGGKKAK